MGGVELRDDTLVVEREPNDLDDLAVRFTRILDDLGIDHVYVSGYVAVLTGRSRSTEDIDVLIERVDPATVDDLADRLEAEGMWGPAMPLDSMAEMLEDNVWVAHDGEMVPRIEAKFVDDEFDRASLENAITARIDGFEVPVGPLELQIAYKLWMRADKDFEDAAHLYGLFEESLRTDRLEEWVERLDVAEEYARLRRT